MSDKFMCYTCQLCGMIARYTTNTTPMNVNIVKITVYLARYSFLLL